MRASRSLRAVNIVRVCIIIGTGWRDTNDRNQIVPVVQDKVVVGQRENVTIRVCEIKSSIHAGVQKIT